MAGMGDVRGSQKERIMHPLITAYFAHQTALAGNPDHDWDGYLNALIDAGDWMNDLEDNCF